MEGRDANVAQRLDRPTVVPIGARESVSQVGAGLVSCQ
jgi:hypothetical protein